MKATEQDHRARRPLDVTAPFDTSFHADPHPVFGWYRDRRPVARITLPNGLKCWLITRYDDVREALSDSRFVSDTRKFPAAWQGLDWGVTRELDMISALGLNLSNADAPAHDWLRVPAVEAFTPARSEVHRPDVARTAAGLLEDAPADESFDILAQYSVPLAVTTMCEVMGVPEEDRESFVDFVRRNSSVDISGDVAGQRAAATRCSDLLTGYVRDRRSRPGLIARMAAALRLEGVPASDMVIFLTHVFVAGADTTSMLISNVVHALLERPELLAAVRKSPELLAPLVEEVIRFDGPARLGHWLFAAEPVVYSGQPIATGDLVVVSLHAANRDPARFARPDELDPFRTDQGHLGFSKGRHFCTGAPLARVEAVTALGTLLAGRPELAWDCDPASLVRRSTVTINGFGALPVRLGTAAEPGDVVRYLAELTGGSPRCGRKTG